MESPPQYLLGKIPISLEESLERTDDILHKLELPQKQVAFEEYLQRHKKDIEELVRFHRNCTYVLMTEPEKWMYGRHNVCIPVHVRPFGREDVLFRVPLPYKVGEERHPGNADEKVRCEVATYIWISKHCPTIPIPHLYGYGLRHRGIFLDHREFEPWDKSLWKTRQRIRQVVGRPPKNPFVKKKPYNRLGRAYMVIGRVAKGRKLSQVLGTTLANRERRTNLFGDLADIMLKLRRERLPRIGSLTVGDEEEVSLTNRPLTQQLAAWDSEGIPTMPREETFENVEAYIMALLDCHDNAIRHQQNAVRSSADGHSQLSCLLMMRALHNQFIEAKHRRGPFALTLTNLQPHNIMVDDKGHIASLIDLDWACSLPVEMLTPPYWLVKKANNDPNHQELINEFLNIFQVKENDFKDHHHDSQTAVMRSCLQRGTFWYLRALHRPKRILELFTEHIQGRYLVGDSNHAASEGFASQHWCPEAAEFIQRRLEAKEAYDSRIRQYYTSNSPPASGPEGYTHLTSGEARVLV